MILTYFDDCIIIDKNMFGIDSFIDSLKEGHEEFDLTNEGSINKYLGVLFKDINENSFEMSQPFSIWRIIKLLSLDEHKTRDKDTPVGKHLLNHDLDGSPQKH